MFRFFSVSLTIIHFFIFLSIASVNLHAQNQGSPIIITEFLASNDDGLLDIDGDTSDWIELFNQSNKTVSLEKWYLTDNPNDPFKWVFPKVSMEPGEFLIVFASGKDLNNPDEELHTNFQLDSEGELLVLIERDKQTIASQFTPVYKPQLENISYGLIQHINPTILVNQETPAKLLVPENNNLDLTWTGDSNHEPFSETNWKTVTSRIGYDRSIKLSEENLAPSGTASQSSEWGGLPADFANDDIEDNFTHTANNDFSPWLDISFDTPQNFGQIVLFNRTTCCQDRLYNITIEVFDAQNNVIYTSEVLNAYEEGETPVSPGDAISLNLLENAPQGIVGNKIRISKTSVSAVREYLSLSEVKIFGIEENDSGDIISNIESDMYGINSSAYIRYPFNLEDLDSFNALLLKIKYNDGFIAYINGTQVVSKNAPTGSPRYNDTANTSLLAENFEQIAIPLNLLNQGQNILAIHGLNISADDLNFFVELELEALQVNTIATQVYFNTPTPGTYNDSDGFVDVVEATQFNHTRGFYDEPFELTISNNTPGTTIIYTTDGSNPTYENGTKISPPTTSEISSANITISKTMVLRTISTKEFFKPTDIETNTYIFLEDVINSDVMDKSITEDEVYVSQMEKALTDLPTVSISLNPDEFNILNNDSLKLASIEWILPNGEIGFQENMGIKHFGGYFTNFDKKNFRLYFKSEFGAKKLRFPLFEGHEKGIEPVTVFDQVELRAGSHDMVSRGFYMSNRFADDTMLDMGNLNPHGQFVHLYINGVYWGQYHLRERWNADMHAQYLGGEKEDYEAINGNKNLGGWAPIDYPYDGDGATWEKVKSLRENYNEISKYLDVSHYIDYMLLYMFGNAENEYRTVGPIAEGSGFKFYLNDADGFLRNTGNRTGMGQPGQQHADGPASIFSMLFKEASPKYKTLLADRIHKHFFNNGALTPEKIEERLLERCNQVENSIIAESARWGYRTPESWETSKNNYINDIAPFRTNTVINHFINAGFYPSIEAPYLNINDTPNYGGEIESGDILSLNATYGDIYYTLDGTDPYIPGDVKKEEQLITLIEENAAKTIFVPTESLVTGWNSDINFDDSSWISGTGSFGYERGNGNTINIDVEDLMYNKQLGCLARIKFDVDNLDEINRLLFYLSYDDAAIVYLNGVKVVSVNASDGEPLYNSAALSAIEASALASFNISEHINLLNTGTNIIAIHGMNAALTSSDFYISTKLVADIGKPEDDELSPSVIKYDGSLIELNETTQIKARAFQYGEWSALSEAEYIIEIIEVPEYLKIKAYPNPFNNGFNITFNSEIDTQVALKVYDALGRMVWFKEYTVEADELSSTSINASLWDNGLYIYQLRLSSGESFSGKLIKKDL